MNEQEEVTIVVEIKAVRLDADYDPPREREVTIARVALPTTQAAAFDVYRTAVTALTT